MSRAAGRVRSSGVWRQVLRPVNVLQVVLGLALVRLGVAVLSGDRLDHDLWAWTVPLLLVLLGALLLRALWPERP